MSRLKNGKIFILISIMLFTGAFLKVLFVDFLSFDKMLTGIYDSLQSGNDIGKFTLTWIPGNNGRTGIQDEDDKSIIYLNPTSNSVYNAESNTTGGAKVTYQVMFNMGGSVPAPPGSILIKLPKNLFYGRDGNSVEQFVDVPLAEYPNNQGTGFNYRYETDSETGEEFIVLENYQTIPESYSFEASISWILKTPSTVKDQYIKEFNGLVDVDLDLDGENDLHSDSNSLTLKYSSHASINSLSDYASTHTENRINVSTNAYLSWNSSWNSALKPENPDDYIYTINYAYGYVYNATQPYSLEVTASPTDNYGGTVVGYCSNSSCSTSATVNTEKCTTTVKTPSTGSQYYTSCGFIIKYPKSNLPDNVEHTLSNKIVENLTGVDGAEDTKEATYSTTFIIKDPDPVVEIEPSSTYVYLDNTIPNPYQSLSKSDYNSSAFQGGINLIETTDNGGKVQVGYVQKNMPYSFSVSGKLQYYKLTYGSDDDDPTALESYGKKQWKYNLIDDIMFIGNDEIGYQKLEPEDYEFESLYISLYMYDFLDTTTSSYNSKTKVTTYRVGWQEKNNYNYQEWPELSVYVKVNNEYSLLGYIKYHNNNYYFRAVDSDEEAILSSNNQLKLPNGTSAVKVTANTNKEAMSLYVYLKASLKSNEKIKSIVKNQKSINVYNYMAAYAEDSNGNIYDYSSKGTLPASMKDTIQELDIAEYGNTISRRYTSFTYNRFEKGKTNKNKWVNYQNDPAYRRVKANYTAYEYDYLEYQTGYFEYNDLFDIKAITEQKNGTFYDLLPIGMSPDLDSIKVETLTLNTSYDLDNTSSNTAKTGTEVDYTATVIDNYNNTGRTMLIVNVKLKDEDTNRSPFSYRKYSNGSYKYYYYVYSGFKITFSGYYSWDSIIDYGTNLTNSIAYKSKDNELFEGYPDDATKVTYTFNDKELFVDLDKDGNPDNTKSDTIYAQRTLSFSFNTASDSSFKISVKTSNMTDYSDGKEESVIASPGGYYTYKLRYESQKNVSTKNLIIYNDLEKYVSETTGKTWQGRIVNVDVSHALEKGINPVVYYSIKDDINLYKNGKATIDVDLPEDADLSNGEIWTTERPEDSFKIKAIAIDLSKDQNGNDYILESQDSVIILVTMQAPTENVEQLEHDNAMALNSAWWAGITKQGDEPEHLNFSVYENTSVVVGEPKASIQKKSYVESGTSTSPAIVHNGDKIIYDIKVSNSSTYESISNVKVVDNLPNAILLIEDDLAYYYEGEGDINNNTKISSNNVVGYEIENQKITFTINQLNSQQEIHLLIPVNVMSRNQNDDIIKNTASIIAFNDIGYLKTSEPTYHETKYGSLKITKKLKDNYDTDNEKEFNIKITLIPPESANTNSGVDSINNKEAMLNNTYSDIDFSNGVGLISLKNNESKTIENLPEGYKFKIEEDLDENFSPTISISEGTIKDNDTINVEIINTRVVDPNIKKEEPVEEPIMDKEDEPENPKTYDDIVEKVMILIISLIGDIIGIYFLRKNIKKEGNS